ncbi:potassium channel family protein [Anaerotignum sp.]|uniref:potassium channel family protein n=1 Tax=Anaerotignum sp. TaxID=2039241 RepID=UPI0028AC4B93|nr:ion transporter [Anaerotignum sp.]
MKTFIKKYTSSVKYELFMILLAFLAIAALFVPIDSKAIIIIDYIIIVFFIIDYLARLYAADNKGAFIRSHIIDLIAALPFHVLFKGVRLLRVIRLMEVARIAAMLTKVGRVLRPFFKTNGFIYLIYWSFGFVIIGTLGIAITEQKNLFDALWWTIVTITTVGYGDISPVTSGGRIIAILLMVFGIGFISTLTSTLTNYFAQKAHSQQLEIHSVIDSLSTVQQNKVLAFARKIIEEDNAMKIPKGEKNENPS